MQVRKAVRVVVLSLTMFSVLPMIAESRHGDRTGVRPKSIGVPLAFEKNEGQAGPGIEFLARGSGSTVLLQPSNVTLLTAGGTPVTITFAGANRDAILTGVEALPGKIHYLRGSDPNQWRRDIRSYRRVHYDEVYKGVDLTLYGSDGELEYGNGQTVAATSRQRGDLDGAGIWWRSPVPVSLSVPAATLGRLDQHGRVENGSNVYLDCRRVGARDVRGEGGGEERRRYIPGCHPERDVRMGRVAGDA